MIIFDEQEIEKKTNDSQNRGFKNGHTDLGFGQEGVSQSAEASQRGNQEILFATPHLIHKDKFDYKKLGNLPDLIQLLADKYIVDNNKVSPHSFCWEVPRLCSNSELITTGTTTRGTRT